MAETALITGASKGIGKALADCFAHDGQNLVIVAQDDAELRSVAEELRNRHGVEVHTIAVDLTEAEAPRRIHAEVDRLGIRVDTLVNNAGAGESGRFWEMDVEEDLSIIRLNIEALVRLTKLFLPAMIARDHGRVLNLGSVAGFQPGPLLAVYHASKAFVLSLSEALRTELDDADSKVTVTCLCPGPTDTHFFERADLEDSRAAQMAADPEAVAEAGFRATMDGERVCVPGASNKVLTFTRRVIPKRVQAKVNKQFYETAEEEA